MNVGIRRARATHRGTNKRLGIDIGPANWGAVEVIPGAGLLKIIGGHALLNLLIESRLLHVSVHVHYPSRTKALRAGNHATTLRTGHYERWKIAGRIGWTTVRVGVVGSRGIALGKRDISWRKAPGGAFNVVTSERQLTHTVRAIHAASRFPRRLHGWQQQPNQYTDDGDHHQQLDQGKTSVSA